MSKAHDASPHASVTTPVILLIFKRSDCVRELIAKLRLVRPACIYVVADGPRPDRPDELSDCEAARAEIDRIDWPCALERIYASENMGCALRVSSGITEVLRREEYAIILEEDCMPDPTFFVFCDELLRRYASDERVMAVTGQSPFRIDAGICMLGQSYHFSRYALCWGWATWRRAWKHYDHEMAVWPQMRKDGAAALRAKLQQDTSLTRYWSKRFDRVYRGEVDSWAYRWTLSCWAREGLIAVPCVNLVQNIGFDDKASTHTRRQHAYLSLPAGRLVFPLIHPTDVSRSEALDRAIEHRNFHHRFIDKVKAAIFQIITLIRSVVTNR